MLEAAGISCLARNEAGVVPDAVGATLTWVVREGATNVVRHSRARRCEIRLTREGDRITAEVRDDGPGPRPKRAGEETGGSGLRGLAERVGASGGDLEAGPLPGEGFGLRVSLPLEEGAPGEVDNRAPSKKTGPRPGVRLTDEDGRP
jgi:two-component system sensor histidine kinase DesK